MSCTIKSSFIAWVVFLTISFPLSAQVLARSGDVSGNVGFSNLTGVDNKKHVAFGGSGAYNLSDRIAVGFDFVYQMMGSVSSSISETENLKIFGPMVRASLTKSKSAVPYVLVAGGGLSMKASSTYQGVSVSASQSGGYIGFGGGATLFASHNCGIRPEFRYERLQFSSKTVAGEQVAGYGQNYYLGTISVFYQFGGKH